MEDLSYLVKINNTYLTQKTIGKKTFAGIRVIKETFDEAREWLIDNGYDDLKIVGQLCFELDENFKN